MSIVSWRIQVGLQIFCWHTRSQKMGIICSCWLLNLIAPAKEMFSYLRYLHRQSFLKKWWDRPCKYLLVLWKPKMVYFCMLWAAPVFSWPRSHRWASRSLTFYCSLCFQQVFHSYCSPNTDQECCYYSCWTSWLWLMASFFYCALLNFTLYSFVLNMMLDNSNKWTIIQS